MHFIRWDKMHRLKAPAEGENSDCGSSHLDGLLDHERPARSLHIVPEAIEVLLLPRFNDVHRRARHHGLHRVPHHHQILNRRHLRWQPHLLPADHQYARSNHNHSPASFAHLPVHRNHIRTCQALEKAHLLHQSQPGDYSRQNHHHVLR